MTTFDKRAKAFEDKFVAEDGARFRAVARRNNKLAAWVVEKLGKPDSETEAYFNKIMNANLSAQTDQQISVKILEEFKAAGLSVTEHQIQHKMETLMGAAVEELRADE